MAVVQPAQDFERADINRKVWVLNTSKYDYSEDFRGDKITVPANGEKKVIMPILAAERFLGQPKYPAHYLPDGQTLAPNSPLPKALKIVELTPEERRRIEGKTTEDLKKKAEETKANARNTCAICGGMFANEKGLKSHVTRMHPEYEPVSSEDSDDTDTGD